MKRLIAAATSALLACTIAILGSGSVARGGISTCQVDDSATFGTTGAEQCYDVPAGVSAIGVEAIGGTGGAAAAPDGSADGSPGGAGVAMSGVLDVEPGQRLYVLVGGNGTPGTPPQGPSGVLNGGYNGGGASNNSSAGGSGGGATDIRTVPCGLDCFGAETLDSRLLVAAGGGGGGYDPGGERRYRGGAGGVPEAAGAPAVGGDGAPDFDGALALSRRGVPSGSPHGRGGTESAGGLGGDGSGPDGESGSLGQGGAGPAGGGGAGLFGGGGGRVFGDIADPSGAGGGGGSSLVPDGFRSDLDETGQPVVVIDVLRPTVRTGPATKRRCRSVTLTGVINAAGNSAAYDFSIGRAGKPLTRKTQPAKVGGVEDIRVSAAVRGLKPGKAYRFRLNAFDSSGGVKTFRTKKRC